MKASDAFGIMAIGILLVIGAGYAGNQLVSGASYLVCIFVSIFLLIEIGYIKLLSQGDRRMRDLAKRIEKDTEFTKLRTSVVMSLLMLGFVEILNPQAWTGSGVSIGVPLLALATSACLWSTIVYVVYSGKNYQAPGGGDGGSGPNGYT